MFWKVAQLDGQDIVIAQQLEGIRGDCSLAYLRLVPLADAAVREWEEDRADPSHKPLIATNDAFRDLLPEPDHDGGGYPRAGGALPEYRLQNDLVGDCFRNVRGLGGKRENCTPTVLRTSLGREITFIAESLRILRSRGINPLKTAMDHAHEMGLEFHVSQRSEMFQTAPPYEECFTTDFYRDHPEWRLRDIDGTEVTGMSYAYSGGAGIPRQPSRTGDLPGGGRSRHHLPAIGSRSFSTRIHSTRLLRSVTARIQEIWTKRTSACSISARNS